MERGAVCGKFKEKVSFCLLLANGLVAFTFIGTIILFSLHSLSMFYPSLPALNSQSNFIFHYLIKIYHVHDKRWPTYIGYIDEIKFLGFDC